MTAKSRLVASLGAIAALGIAAVFFWTPGGPSSSPTKVRAGYLPIVASLPLFVAKHEGLFAREGLEVETVAIQNSNDIVNALIAGQVDVLPAVSLVPVLHLEVNQPGRVRLFSHSRMKADRAFDSIVVKADSPLQALRDLGGKKVGVFPGTSATNILRAVLAREGLDPQSVTFVPLPPPAQLTSLESGAIEALFSYEPITTIAASKGYRRLFGSVYAALQDPCPIGASVISRAFEREHPAEAAAFIRAIDEAVKRLRSEDARLKSLLPEFTPVSAQVAAAVNYVDVTTEAEIDPQNVQQFARIMKDIGETEKLLDAQGLLRR